MFRKDEHKMPIKIALCYMLAQVLGAFVGALLLNFYTFDLQPLDYTNKLFFRALTQEALTTFIYVFFFMTCTDDKLLFSNEKAINCFILASSYVGARSMFVGQSHIATTYGAVANPAMALGIMMSTLINNGLSAWSAIYIYPLVPFGGSFLAVLFYELVYKKTQAFLSHEEEHSDNGSVKDDGALGEHD